MSNVGSKITTDWLRSQSGSPENHLLREHLRVYSTPKLPAFEFVPIDERLIAGRNPLTAMDVAQLQLEGVTHILDLRTEPEWSPPKFGADAIAAVERAGLQRVWIPVGDMMAPTPEALDQAVGVLGQLAAQPETKAYVHCRAGQERTGAVLAAYWAMRRNLGYDAALAELRRARPSLRPLPEQEQAVREWLKARGRE